MQSGDRHVRIADSRLRHIEDSLDVEAELHALHTGVGLDVRLRRQVRVDAQGHRGNAVHRSGNICQGSEFRFALYVEKYDLVLKA